ncbi:MAG: alpha/beta fold hydrolase [Pseudomonadota bacterium]
MSRWRILLLLYLLVLIASNATRLARNNDPDPGNMRTARVQLDGGAAVQMAYRDLGPRNAPVVLALHGSPAASGFGSIAPGLADRYRVIVPHMPGFGRSSRRLPDYSVATHARYVAELLDQLEIERVHIIGYSMGGGVALSFNSRFPGRTDSLVLLSAIGVQELEMFGHYALNHVVHGVQLAGLLALEWGVPHFGALDDMMLNSRYARNFYDTDQRPLRAALENFSPPLLIVHGRDDALVPYAAALEHERIVPHSNLVSLDGGHGLVFQKNTPVLPPIRSFLDSVVAESVPTRAEATPARVARALEPIRNHVSLKLTGLALALAMLTLALSTLISEDAACIVGGLLVASDAMSFTAAAGACLVGIYIGDALVFAAGRHLGAPSLSRAPLKWLISTDGVEAAKAWFATRGGTAILASRFIPGTRLPTYLAAGALGLSFVRFSGWFLLAAVLWTPALVGAATYAGHAIEPVFEQYSAYALPVVVALIVVMLMLMRVLLPLSTYRGRRLLLGRWRRLTRWEFWPRWAFYPPLVIYVMFLGWRHRSLTLFTAANPAMPDGGFVGESKIDILSALGKASPDYVATFAELPSGSLADRVRTVTTFINQHDLGFPVVLKPDVGERGSDVCIAHDLDAVTRYLSAHHARTLVQAFAPGREFGVFYVRHPNEPSGKIFAITDKHPPVVTGDGVRTLENLILDDNRAVCMAPTYLERHAERLYDVPAPGESITLVDIGTHSRGCVFLDGDWVRSEALEHTIDAISRDYDGFFFGRYDLRTPDVDAFRAGGAFRIVELNGVSSEATNIYDPKHGLLDAYRILMRQWRLAFEIGHQQRTLGVAPTPLLDFLRTLWRETVTGRNAHN